MSSRVAARVVIASLAVGCANPAAGVPDVPRAAGCVAPRFGAPEAVTVEGWSADVMEPFVTRDGALLLFNDSNAPGRDTQLHVATRVDDLRFRHVGELAGTQTAALEGVPSAAAGELYFVSTRSYATTLATVYRAAFAGGAASAVALVPGVSRDAPGWVNFDAEVAADGQTLYLVDGHFDPATMFWSEADLLLATRTAAGFARVSTSFLAAVNTPALEYAPATSADERVLYFTRLVGTTPRIFVAVRADRGAPFCAPVEVVAAAGFVEGPTVAPDGALYYHHRDDDGVYRLRRLAVTP